MDLLSLAWVHWLGSTWHFVATCRTLLTLRNISSVYNGDRWVTITLSKLIKLLSDWNHCYESRERHETLESPSPDRPNREISLHDYDA